MVFRCCVPGCKTKAKNGFHSFPANEQIRAQWIHQTKTFHLDPAKLTNSFYRICRLHFRDSDLETTFFGDIRLKKNAIPSLLLPNAEKNGGSVC